MKLVKVLAFFRQVFFPRKKILKSCGNHDKLIVVFKGSDCPLCTAERSFKRVWEELEKSMAKLKALRQDNQIIFRITPDGTVEYAPASEEMRNDLIEIAERTKNFMEKIIKEKMPKTRFT